MQDRQQVFVAYTPPNNNGGIIVVTVNRRRWSSADITTRHYPKVT
jgi:hypothetical protein